MVTLYVSQTKGASALPEPRDTAVTIRMSAEEKRMLDAVAEAKGLSISDVVRQAIRAEHAKVQRKAAR